MLAGKEDILMIPVIGTGFGVVEEGVVPSMVIRDGTSSLFELIAALMWEGTIFAFMSI
jgi:hypothetical protein